MKKVAIAYVVAVFVASWIDAMDARWAPERRSNFFVNMVVGIGWPVALPLMLLIELSDKNPWRTK